MFDQRTAGDLCNWRLQLAGSERGIVLECIATLRFGPTRMAGQAVFRPVFQITQLPGKLARLRSSAT
jgi:hypothetical protein